MKKLLLLLIGAGTAIYSSAQTLPKPSPGAEVEQQIGATEIEINYSRPGAKDRTVFGELVPFDKLWRFGANSATTISTEHTLIFEEGKLEAGTYAVFAIPNKDSWEIIFNTDTKASADDYNQEKDALRVKAAVSENAFTETFTLSFDNIRDESATFVVLWEKTKVAVDFKLNTKENSIANINEAVEKGEDLSSVYNNAANFYFSSLKDNKTALDYVNKSVELGADYRNLFLQARILAEQGKKDEALNIANKALDLAKENASIGYQNFISGTIEKWSK